MNMSTIDLPQPDRRCFLIENAALPPASARKLAAALGIPGPVRFRAMTFLMTRGTCRNYVALVGFHPKRGLTPMGEATLGALISLPCVAEDAPVWLAYIPDVASLERVISRTLAAAPDGAWVGFVGDIAGELDVYDWDALDPIGWLRLPVDIDATGWPLHWQAFDEASEWEHGEDQ
jgi:hypothetical protein